MISTSLQSSTQDSLFKSEVREILSVLERREKRPLSKLYQSFVSFKDEVNNKLKSISTANRNTVIMLIDSYEPEVQIAHLNSEFNQILQSKTKIQFRSNTLSNLIRDGKYLEYVSRHKPEYVVLNISGTDFLLADRIEQMFDMGSNSISVSDRYDVIKLVLKKSLQQLYFTIQMLSPTTKVHCHEIYYSEKLEDNLIQLGIDDKQERAKLSQMLLSAYCEVLQNLARRYENFSYDGCRNN